MAERDYVLGTQDEEIERLGLQHRVWRARMLEGWQRAGIGAGQRVIDVGAGPGYAALDLAKIVGPGGHVLAVERSRRFLNSLELRARSVGLGNIETLEADVGDGFGEGIADAAWCRWVLCFVPDPQRVLGNILRSLKPGGVAIFHEYADYGAWQMMPPNEDLDRFRELVMKSWRDAGGEPDIALRLPEWLMDEGLEFEIRPLIDVISPEDFTWQWPAAFMAVNAHRLNELGYATDEEAARWSTLINKPAAHLRMVTPLVTEIIARKVAS